MSTAVELLAVAAIVAGVFLNWGVGWALIVAGALILAGLTLAGLSQPLDDKAVE